MPKSKSEHFDLSGKSKSRSKKSASPANSKEVMSKPSILRTPKTQIFFGILP